ncbi:M20 family metallopeptidase [Siminovitchia sediminis]|uniref:M20 family metallopeptidase n=1 Tax=Siminovitchia sediminis TaxID=1274353 RepID=A0ABW4KCQ1_9BACI
MIKQEIEILTSKLISFKTYNQENVNQCMDFIFDWLQAHDLQPEILINSQYQMVVLTIGEGNKTLVLNGHVDVVQGHPPQFAPFVEGDRLYGRGALDMLGSVAIMMILAKELKNKNLGIKVMFQFCPDEETGGHYGTSYFAEQGYTGDFVICLEPTDLNIGIECKGVIQLEIEVLGKAAHGSRPWLGENAIINAVNLYEKIKNAHFTKSRSEFFPNYSVNLARIRGGHVINSVPDRCTITVEIRFLPEQDPEDVLKEVEQIVGPGRYKILNIYPPVKVLKDNDYVQQLSRLMGLSYGKTPKLFGQDGTADSRFFAKQGIPAVEFGPSGEGQHGDNEYVSLDSLVLLIDILQNFITNISSCELTESEVY